MYTVSSCHVECGTCFQCTRFLYVMMCMEHAFSVHGFFMSCCDMCVCALTQFVVLPQENKPTKGDIPAYEIVHLVDLTNFEWKDSETNCPPRCLTCPVYLKGYTPCIGILTVLSNVSPIQFPNEERPASVSLWLGNSPSLCKPEVFHNRWRTDKDPTRHLTKYSLIPSRVRKQCVLTCNSCTLTLYRFHRAMQLPRTIKQAKHCWFQT